MKKLALAIATAGLIGTPAFAADMAVKAPPPAPAAPSCLWCGWYVGGNAGVGWDHQNFSSAPQATLVSSPLLDSLQWGENVSASANHFIGGGQIGYNTQNGIWVASAEWDFDAYGANATNTNVFTGSLGTVVNNSFSSKTSWIMTSRLRFGVTPWSPNLLLYVTGGWALVHEEVTGLINATHTPTGIETFPFSSRYNSGGWVLGGGAEWAIDQHWSIKAEYLHIGDLSGPSQITPLTQAGAAPAAFGGSNTLAADAMSLSATLRSIDIARGGVNYRF